MILKLYKGIYNIYIFQQINSFFLSMLLLFFLWIYKTLWLIARWWLGIEFLNVGIYCTFHFDPKKTSNSDFYTLIINQVLPFHATFTLSFTPKNFIHISTIDIPFCCHNIIFLGHWTVAEWASQNYLTKKNCVIIF